MNHHAPHPHTPPPNRTRRDARRQRGFSTAELLVVMFIVIVLIGTATYALRQFRSQGRETQTQSILQMCQSAATEYQAATGSTIDPYDATIQWPAECDTTIERFLWQANKVKESADILRNLSSQMGGGNNPRAVEFMDPDDADWIDRKFPTTDNDRYPEIVDAWGHPLEYVERNTEENGPLPQHDLPVHPRPFFASPGADGEFGDASNPPNNNQRLLAGDNIYSFNLE